MSLNFNICDYVNDQLKVHQNEDSMIESLSKEPSRIVEVFKSIVLIDHKIDLKDLANKINTKIESISDCLDLEDRKQLDLTINAFKLKILNPDVFNEKINKLKEFSKNVNEEDLFEYLEVANEFQSKEDLSRAIFAIDKNFGVALQIKNDKVIVSLTNFELAKKSFYIIFSQISEIFNQRIEMEYLNDSAVLDLREIPLKIINDLEKDPLLLLHVYPGLFFKTKETEDNEFIDRLLGKIVTDSVEFMDLFRDLLDSDRLPFGLNEISLKFLKRMYDCFEFIKAEIQHDEDELRSLTNLEKRYLFFLANRNKHRKMMLEMHSFANDLNFKNILLFIRCAKILEDSQSIASGFSWIEDSFPIKIKYEGEMLEISLKLSENDNIKSKKFSIFMKELIEIFNHKITFNVSLQYTKSKKKELKRLIDKLGNQIYKLSIKSNEKMRSLLESVFNQCKNLHHFSLKGPFSSMKRIGDLESLKTLQIESETLIKLEGPFQESLVKLKLKKCPQLKEILAIPPKLKKLTIENCQNLSKFHFSVPTTLDIMEITHCKSFTRDNAYTFLIEVFKGNLLQGLKFLPSLLPIHPNEKIQKDILNILKQFYPRGIKEHLSLFFHVWNSTFFSKMMAQFLITEDFESMLDYFEPIFLSTTLKSEIRDLDQVKKISSYQYVDQLSKNLKMINEIQIVDHPEISICQLLDLFDEVNRENGFNYKIVEDDGTVHDLKYVQEGISKLISHIEREEIVLGVPKDEKERNEWYQRLSNLIKQFIYLATHATIDKKQQVSRELISIGIGAYHCGERWLGDLIASLEALSDECKISLESLEENIIEWMDLYKTGFMSDMNIFFSKRIGAINGPHIQNKTAMCLKKEGFSLKNQNFITLNDDLIADELIQENEIIEKIGRYFHPLMIIKYIRGKIHEECRMNPQFTAHVLVPFEDLAKRIIIEENIDIETQKTPSKLQIESPSTQSKKRQREEGIQLENPRPLKKQKIDQAQIDQFLVENAFYKMDEMMIDVEFTYKGVFEILRDLKFLKK